MSGSSGQQVALRKSRRLAVPSGSGVELHGTKPDDDTTQMTLPDGCELVAGTFVVFRWQEHPCLLQVNVTLYCWGGQRSGALEMVLEEYGLTRSPQIHHINSKLVTGAQWVWLRQVFIVVRRLFDASETCDTAKKVHWLNVVDCRLVYDLLRRQCHRYRRNLFPEAGVLNTHLKRCGIELEPWYQVEAPPEGVDVHTPTPIDRSATPPSSTSGSSPTASPSSKSPTTADDDASSSLGAGGGLGEREWLSDVHVANVMFLLVHGQLALPLEQRDVFQCTYPMTDALFIHMLQQAEPGSLLTHATTRQGVALAFINPNNNHWRLVVLDGLQRQVVLFDPLGAPLPSSVVRAVTAFVGPSYRVIDLELEVQAESWNCGVWALYAAARYITAAAADGARMDVATLLRPPRGGDGGAGYVILGDDASSADRHLNRVFADELRRGYSELLGDAASTGRLLYSADDERPISHTRVTRSPRLCLLDTLNTVEAGTARTAYRHRRFIDRTVSDQVWIDLTEEAVGETVVAAEAVMVEQSFDDLCDHYVEFREDNVDNPVAATLRYSLPVQQQSDVLKEQIERFRGYRRQRFSLFRRGPLVEETTIASNVSAVLRFLGYLFYEQEPALRGAPLDLTVFALDDISQLVLSYVEWLEKRRGSRRQRAPTGGSAAPSFQPVSCATVANYLNGLVSIVKFQLCHDIDRRDRLLDQLRNLRSQAESYSMAQKGFEKVHPEWCSWQDVQLAREKCRETFDRRIQRVAGRERERDIDDDDDDDADTSTSTRSEKGRRAHLLHLREVCLLGLFTICPPPRCSVIRLLEWDKTLVEDDEQGCWVVDLTDVSHAATRHKTHKKKGAMRLPLSTAISPYLSMLRQTSHTSGGAVFPSASTASVMSSTSFTTFVKHTFRKYTPGGQAPNPSLLRSIFTTWLYSLRYDTEDAFLQQIKASSAKWKAHSEHVAATVYNRELVYQQKEFALLLRFCEEYAKRYAYDRSDDEVERSTVAPSLPRKRSKRSRAAPDPGDEDREEEEEPVFTVDGLIRTRVTVRGEKQVLVRWEGYRRPTWEPFASIQEQLPEMVAELESSQNGNDDDDDAASSTSSDSKEGEDPVDDDHYHAFLSEFIAQHHIDRHYRWSPDRLNTLEHAALSAAPAIRETADQLRQGIMSMVRSTAPVPPST